MVYLIIGILILLFYIFAVPASIKGTLNAVTLVLLIVALIILFGLGLFQVFRLPAEYFVGFGLSVIAILALRDISRLKPPNKSKKQADQELE
ncbi:DUF3165 family protein [Streptococcus panodentis]|uniref:DUF3165 domain-containing protein n=1 Tax=Streptococcus panodentis TaxID=1581472 RepID=A0ABS5AY98_9STRE|nr:MULTISPECIES: DUF3165 family protein [Streptococcus]KXT81624.1 hypothetical protein STRDD11_01991 [Streptococcus sp. DD11]MBP2621510.1 DUF3165 domain-containing protein [Streptococcus panodentis]